MRVINAEYIENTVKTMRVDRILNRSVGIIGLARSGLAVAKLVKRLGGHPFISDYMPEENFQSQISELKMLAIPFETGAHTERLLEHSDFLIVSPGVPNDVPIVRKAEAVGIPVFSELEVASWLCDAGLVAITGSNGKTTTTTLLNEILKGAGYESAAAGNIGYPFSEVCDRLTSKGWIALEVSSFQLERIFDFRPHIAIILNLTPDHLDRYGDFEEYARIKLRIAENMSSGDYLVINADDKYLVKHASQTDATKIYFSQDNPVSGVFLEGDKIIYDFAGKSGDLGLVNDIRIPGPHNLYNAMAAAASALLAGVDNEVIRNVFHTFPGVEHRLEYVDTIDGVSFINDSKATNVDSVWYAIQSVPREIVLIMGGKYKGGDLARLNSLIRERVKHLILIGESTERFQAAYTQVIALSTALSLEAAVKAAAEIACKGDTVLLSPACASFDMFDDFEHRGRVFKESVAKLRGTGE